MSSAIDQINSHLEFLGYEIIKGENGAMAAKHKSHFNLLYREFGYGILFSAFFSTNANGKHYRANVLERINSFNTAARVCHAYIDKDGDLTVEAYIPAVYDKGAFGTFVETFNSDFSLIGRDEIKLVEYLE